MELFLNSKLAFLIVSFYCAVPHTSYGLHDPHITLPEDDPPSRQLVNPNTQFSLSMYRELVKNAGDDNIFFSPFSIATLFSLLYHGSRGATASQLHDALGFGEMTAEDIASAYKELLGVINKPEKAYELRTANRIYARLGINLRNDFRAITSQSYQAEVVTADFERDPEGSRRQINSWVEQQTNDKIRDLLAAGTIDPDTAMVLVNAIYFKGIWKTTFNAEQTHPRPFTKADGTKVGVQMMSQKSKFRTGYLNKYETQVLELPYTDDEVSMIILLPRHGVDTLEQHLTPGDLASVTDGLRSVNIQVYLPKFKLEYSQELMDPLTRLGITDLFSPERADLSGIAGTRNLYVSHAIHKAFLQVDEEGTEAAAATAVVVSFRSARRTPEFVADRPFLVLLRENKTKQILFMGRFSSPGPDTTVE